MRTKQKRMMVFGFVMTFMVTVLFMPGLVGAGDLEPTDPPGPTMKTLDEIYDKLEEMDGKIEGGSCEWAPVEKTGQTEPWGRDDGYYQKGVPWPVPRFTTGTYVVTDNLTGLMWTKDASLTEKYWPEAIDYCEGLMIWEPAGAHTILFDDWRLPNIKELQSLIDFSNSDPALPSGHPFTGVELHDYWSSTTYSDYYSLSWIMNFAKGLVNTQSKTSNRLIWVVRGGQ